MAAPRLNPTSLVPGTSGSVTFKAEDPTRTVNDGVLVINTATVTSNTMQFVAGDVGKTISGVGIPAGTTLLSVQSLTSATMSATATLSGNLVRLAFLYVPGAASLIVEDPNRVQTTQTPTNPSVGVFTSSVITFSLPGNYIFRFTAGASGSVGPIAAEGIVVVDYSALT